MSIFKFIGTVATFYKQSSPLSVLRKNRIPSINQNMYFGILHIGGDSIWE